MLINRFFKFLFALIVWTLEVVARFIWLATPIGIHMLLLQFRKNVDKLPALTGYFNEESTWQMIYDGAVLVNTNPGAVRRRLNNTKRWFIDTRWYWLILAVLILLGTLGYIAYKLH